MDLAQYIYTTTCTDRMTIEKAVLISEKSVEVCNRLGLTGRVFSTASSTLAITEGPATLVGRYVGAVHDDYLLETLIVHARRPIEAREFSDYSVWLDMNVPATSAPHVHIMTPGSLQQALPANPSAKLRVMADVFFDQGRLVA